VKPPPWRDEEAVIAWGVKRFWEIWGETEYLEGSNAEEVPAFIPGMGWTTVTPPAHMPSKTHEMMLGLIMAEENRKVLRERTALPESEAGVREAALSGWTEPLALLIQQHVNPVEGFRKVERISPETWHLVLEFVRGERNPKTGKPTGRRGPRKKTSAEKRRDAGTHDATDFVPVIRTYLREAYPKQDTRQIHDHALKIAAIIKGVARPETIATHSKRGRRDRHRAP
jgi:hypothetical protein